MNTEDLIKALARSDKISQPKAKKIVRAFIESLEEILKSGDKVIFSNFGSFLTHKYPSKTIRDPRGRGHQILMLPTNVIKWHPSPDVRKRIDKVNEVTETEVATEARVEPLPKNESLPESHESTESRSAENNDVPIHMTEPHKDQTKIPVSQNSPSEAQTEVQIHTIDKPPATKDEQKPDEPPPQDQVKKTGPVSFEDFTANTLSNKSLPATEDQTDQPDNVVVAKLDKQPEKDLPSEIKPEIKQLKEVEKVKTPDEPVQAKTDDDSVPRPEVKASLTENELGEITNSQDRPRISFEDFVKKTKDDMFSTPDENNAKPAEQANLKQIDSEEITPQEVKDLKKDSSTEPGDSAGNAYVGATGVQFIDLSKTNVDKNVLSLLPEKVARQFQVVPVTKNGSVLTVAMTDPEDLETIELVKKQTGYEVIAKLTVQADLNRILDQYSGVEAEVSEAITQSEDETKDSNAQKEQSDKKLEKIVEDAPVSRIVTSLIKRAVRELASDIHIEPTESGLDVRFREDGVLQKKVTIPKAVQASVTSRVKILSGIKIDEARLPQDGRIQMMVDNRKVDFRVSTMPTAFGEKIVMRILDKSTGVLTLGSLGLRGRGFDVVENSIHKSHGMTLVTGPTGSGKTTTLYAIIDRLLDVAVNIVTLEDPIEYQMPGINQSQVNPDIDYTFANGLRSILRQDPDVVMIGEIRDRDTAEMAVNAALTGHVVLSTLHTNDSAGAGPRLIDMGVEPFLITSSLNTVIAQRLARTICKQCKNEAKINDKEIEEVKKEIAKMPADARKRWEGKKLVFYEGKGCENCHDTGYKGRIGIYEVLDVNQKIQELLLSRATSGKITEAAIADGMLTMKQEGIDKALDGITSLEEVWRVTKD